MKTIKRLSLSAAGLLALGAAPALAHHSFAMFDATKFSSVTGTLYAVEWKNPHGWFWLKAKGPNGKEATWGFEGTSPGSFAAQGLKKSDFTVGEKVKIDFHPLKDGRPGGQFLRATFANGKTVGSLNTSIDDFRKKGYIK